MTEQYNWKLVIALHEVRGMITGMIEMAAIDLAYDQSAATLGRRDACLEIKKAIDEKIDAARMSVKEST